MTDGAPAAPSSRTLAPASGSDVSSASTWPTTTPSDTTVTARETSAPTLPARSVAWAATVNDWPLASAAGASSGISNGGWPSVAAGWPSIRNTTWATPEPVPSLALAIAFSARPRTSSDGAASSTSGGWLSRTTPTWAEPWRARASSPTASIALAPSASGSEASVKVAPSGAAGLPVTTAGNPLTRTDCSVASRTVPVTATLPSRSSAASSGAVIVTTGKPVSSRTSRVSGVSLPARSRATALKVCGPSPRPPTSACHARPVTVAVTPSTVTRSRFGSSTVPWTRTGCDPSSASGSGLAIVNTCGAVRSIVTVTLVGGLVFDAVSVASTTIACSPSPPSGTSASKLPSEATTAGSPSTVTDAIPEASVARPWTCTLVSFVTRPGPGASITTVGATVSVRTLTKVEPAFPAASRTVAVSRVLAPSVIGTCARKLRGARREAGASSGVPLTSTWTSESSSTVPSTSTTGPCTVSPSAGRVIVTVGVRRSTRKRTVARPTLPAASSASASIATSGPSPTGTPAAVKVAPVSTASTPATLTRTMAEASATVPETSTVAAETKVPSCGAAIATTGGRLSTLNSTGVAMPSLPAASRIRASSRWLPSARTVSAGTSAVASEAPLVNQAVRSCPSSVTTSVAGSTPDGTPAPAGSEYATRKGGVGSRRSAPAAGSVIAIAGGVASAALEPQIESVTKEPGRPTRRTFRRLAGLSATWRVTWRTKGLMWNGPTSRRPSTKTEPSSTRCFRPGPPLITVRRYGGASPAGSVIVSS